MPPQMKHEPYIEYASGQRRKDAEELKRINARQSRLGWLCRILGHKSEQMISIESGPIPGKFHCPRCGRNWTKERTQ